MKRVGNGQGSIYQRVSGRWVAAAYVLCEDGFKRRKTRTTKTRKEAQTALVDMQKASTSGVPYQDQKITVSLYLSEWMERHKENLAPRTAQRYEGLIKLYLKPLIGRYKVVELRPIHVEYMMAEMRKQGLGARTIAQGHAVLRKSLSDAQRHEMINRNVAKLVSPPPHQTPERAILQPDQAQRFVNFVAGTRAEAAVYLALFQGMRLGEVLGLQWAAVNFDHDLLVVRTQLQRTQAGLVLREPKSRSSRRVLPLSPDVRAHLQRIVDERASPPPGEEHIVLSTTRTPWDPDNFGSVFKGIALDFLQQEKLGGHDHTPMITFHSLRHTYASIGLALSGDVKSVQETLGHSSALLTLNIYGHALDKSKQRLVGGVGQAIHTAEATGDVAS